jgi:hypothetical protein
MQALGDLNVVDVYNSGHPDLNRAVLQWVALALLVIRKKA